MSSTQPTAAHRTKRGTPAGPTGTGPDAPVRAQGGRAQGGRTQSGKAQSGRATAEQRQVTRSLARQQQVVEELLSRHGLPIAVDELASRVGVSERTMERELERLRQAHLPIRGRGGRRGGVWLDVAREVPGPLDVTQSLLLLLVLDQLDAELPPGLASARTALVTGLEGPGLF